jgi:hypothetical protein
MMVLRDAQRLLAEQVRGGREEAGAGAGAGEGAGTEAWAVAGAVGEAAALVGARAEAAARTEFARREYARVVQKRGSELELEHPATYRRHFEMVGRGAAEHFFQLVC